MPKNSSEGYRSFGIERGTEIFRYRHTDGSLSGIIFRYDGGLLTARHVVNAHNLKDFTRHPGKDLDMAYKVDGESKGLKLGYVEKIILDDVTMITSDINEPDRLVTIPGRTGCYFLPTSLSPFYPKDQEGALKFFKQGGSGSPLIYKDHIIGLVPFKNNNDPYEVAVILFSGKAMEGEMERFGLALERID